VTWQAPVAVAGGLALLWLLLVAAFYALGRRHDDPTRLRDALRLLPDVARLLHRLAADRTLPRGVRVRVVLLGLYLVVPIDLVPDVVPVAGYADDVLVVVLTLRSIARRAGVEAIDRHWPGTPEGLELLKRLAALP
jgi:uncharacterized membrane protein YkvA (DUF1232 family)